MPANIDELNITISADATKAMEEIKRLADQLKKLGGKYPGFAKALKELDSTEKSAKKSANSAKKAAKDVGDAAKQAGAAAKKATGDMSKGMDSAAKAAQKAQKSMSNLGKGMPKIEFDFKGIDATKDQIKAAMKEAQGELPRLVAEYGAQDAVNIAKNRARVMAQQLSEGLRTLNASHATGRTKEDIERDAQKEAEWKAKADERQAAKFQEREEKYQRMMSGWRSRNGGASTQTDNSVPQISRTAEALNKLKVVAGGVRKALNPANLSPYNMSKGIVSGVDIAIGAFRRLIGTIPNVNYAISKGLVSGVGNLGGVMGRAGGAVGSFVWSLTKIHAAGTAAVTLGVLARMTRTVSSGFKTLAKAAGSVPFKVFTTGANIAKTAVSKLGSALKNVHSSSNASTHSFRNMMRFTLSAVFGVRSIYSLVRRMRSAVIDSFKDLAKHSSSLDTALRTLKGSLHLLSDSFATAFEPVLTVATPYIRKFIDWIVSGLNALNQFFSALTGRSTWTKATFKMGELEDSTKKAADGTKKAKDAAEEYKKTLMGFDKINKLNDPTGSGSGSGSGSESGDSSGGVFTTEEISTGISDFANMVKEAWMSSDFTDVGKIVGEKLADALGNIPWDKVKSKAKQFGKSFATFVNGVVSVKELAVALGKTIGESINTIFTGANAFITNLEFGKIGDFIATAMNSGIATVDWDLIASTLSEAANGVFTLAATWANKFDFGALGTNVGGTITSTLNGIEWDDAKEACETIGTKTADAINNFVAQNPLTAVGDAIAGAITAVVSGTYSFADNVEWGTVGEDLAGALNSIVGKEELWNGVADTIVTTANGIFKLAATWSGKFKFKALGRNVGKAITRTLKKLEWKDAETVCKNLGTGVADAINKVVEEKPLTVVADAIANALNAAVSGMKDFIDTTSWESVGEEIASSINKFFKTFDFGKAGVTLGSAVNSLFTLFNTAVEKIKWKNVGKKIMSAVKAFFTTFKWSNISETISGIYVALLDLFTGAIGEIKWEKVPGDIINAITEYIKGVEFKEMAAAVGSFIGALVAAGLNLGLAIYNKLKDGAVSIGEYFAKYIQEAGFDTDNTLIENAGAIATGILKGVANVFAEIAGWAYDNLVKPFIDGFKEAFGIGEGDTVLGALGDAAKSIGVGILNGIKEGVKNIGGFIETNLIDPIKEKILNAFPEGLWRFFGIDKQLELELIAKKRKGFDEAIISYESVKDESATKQFEAKKTSDFTDIAGMYTALTGDTAVKKVDAKETKNFGKSHDDWNNMQSHDVVVKLNAIELPQFVKSAVKWTKDIISGTAKKFLDVQWTNGSNERKDGYIGIKNDSAKKIIDIDETKDWIAGVKSWFSVVKEKVTKTVDASETKQYSKTREDYAGVLVNGTATKTVDIKKTKTFIEGAIVFTKDLINSTAKKTIEATETKTFLAAAKSYASVQNETASKTVSAKYGDLFKTVLAQWVDDLKDGQKATKTLNLKEGDKYNERKDGFVSLAPTSSATKTLTLKKDKDYADTRKSYVSLEATSNAAKTLKLLMAKGYNTAKESYDSIKTATTTKTLKAEKDKSLTDADVVTYINLPAETTANKTLNITRAKAWVDETWQKFINPNHGDEKPTATMEILRERESWSDAQWQKFMNPYQGDKKPTANIEIVREREGWNSDQWQTFINPYNQPGNYPTAKIVIERWREGWNSDQWQTFINPYNRPGNYPKATIVMERWRESWSNKDWQIFVNQYHGNTNPSAKMTIHGELSDSSKKSMGNSVFEWAKEKIRSFFGFASGGSYYGGTWHSISQYAAGGVVSPSHGSLFVAGEKGAETVGHINGRTEVLNQSQMASVMYSAVYGAMMAAAANSPNGAVNVYLQGDAKGLFKAVQTQANMYTQMTGQPAFNL